MATEFGLELSEQLCRFLSISASEDELVAFARAIDFHAKYLGESNRDDLAPLLFIECVEEAEKRKKDPTESSTHDLQVSDLRTILSRVQKRLYRSAKTRAHSSPDVLESQTSSRDVDSIIVQRVLNDFRTYVVTSLSPRDGVIFKMRFIDGRTIPDICVEIGMEKTSVYERIRAVKKLFAKFLEDVGYPDFSES